MSGPRSLLRSTGTIPLNHRPAFPAGDAHQVRLVSAAGQPVMRERVTKLVWVHLIAKAGLSTSSPDHLGDATI